MLEHEITLLAISDKRLLEMEKKRRRKTLFSSSNIFFAIIITESTWCLASQ